MQKYLCLLLLFSSLHTTSQPSTTRGNWLSHISRMHIYGFVSGCITSAARQVTTKYLSNAIKSYIRNVTETPAIHISLPNDFNPPQDRSMQPSEKTTKNKSKDCPIAHNMYGIIATISTLASMKHVCPYQAKQRLSSEQSQKFITGWRFGSFLSSCATCVYLQNTDHPRLRGEAIYAVLSLRITYDSNTGWSWSLL